LRRRVGGAAAKQGERGGETPDAHGSEENRSRCAYSADNGVGTVVKAMTVVNANATSQKPKRSLETGSLRSWWVQ
jgi:hypothetical protein